MRITRRSLLAAAASWPAAAANASGLKIGVMDGVLRMSGKPEAVAAAKRLGCEGLQVTLGRPKDGERLPLMDAETQGRYLEEVRQHKLPIAATYLDVLHANCLKSDLLARKWVEQGIEITRRLNAGVLMTVFFGGCSINSREEADAVAKAFKYLAPVAEKAQVVLGFENLLNAEDNARVMEKVASKAFRIYYDVGNAANMIGVDPGKEIRWLGKERICQFHFKDKGYLGEGKVDFPAVSRAIEEIGFHGFANLETGSPSGAVEKDVERNLAYLRGLTRG